MPTPPLAPSEYAYASLEAVRNTIPAVAQRVELVVELGDNLLEVEVEAALEEVYRVLIDIDHRSNWFIGSQVTEREEVTERIGLKHMCLFDGILFEITIAESQIGDAEIVYAEDVKVVEAGVRLLHTYRLRRLSDLKTLVSVEFKQIEGAPLPEEMSRNMSVVFKRNLEALKQQCET